MKLVLLDFISRLIGCHKLLVLNFYSHVQRSVFSFLLAGAVVWRYAFCAGVWLTLFDRTTKWTGT